MFGIGVTREELKQQAAIQRRQRLEAERKERIFNPRRRVMGVDKEALKSQIDEKREREEQERQMNLNYAKEASRQALLFRQLNDRIENDRRQVQNDLQAFRSECQKYEDRREFDLNNPREYARRNPEVPDDDKKCGPSSLRKFEGDDLYEQRRKAEQDRQKTCWLEAQIREKEQTRKEYEAVQKLWEQQQHEQQMRVLQLTAAEECARRQIELETSKFNLAMSNEARERKELEKLADEQATLAHNLNMYNSELMTETTDATHCNGPFRTTTTRWKGFSPEQIRVVKEEQYRQTLDNARRKEEEKKYEDAWGKMQRRFAIARSILDKELDERRKDQQQVMNRTNMELAREQRMRQEYLNRIVYRNSCSEDFFEQFNTTTR